MELQGWDQAPTPTFTVFTATYNRARTLPRVYESLSCQTFRDFEWLIVDDGSTDDTARLVSGWQDQSNFPIRYFPRKHEGLSAAKNFGVQEAKGLLFLILDSDDACVPHALERFKYHWDSIPPTLRADFSAVTALCVDQHGNLVGDEYPDSPTDSNTIESRYRLKVKGEKWGFHRTDVLRRFPFPVSDQLSVPEGLVWHAISTEYKTRYVNERLRIYWCNEADRTDQVSHHQSFAAGAPGTVLFLTHVLNHDIGWFAVAPGQFFWETMQYCRFSFHAQKSCIVQVKTLENALARLLWGVAVPAGYALYRMDRHGVSKRLKSFLRR